MIIVGFVITDGQSTDPNSLRASIAKVKGLGIEIYAVGGYWYSTSHLVTETRFFFKLNEQINEYLFEILRIIPYYQLWCNTCIYKSHVVKKEKNCILFVNPLSIWYFYPGCCTVSGIKSCDRVIDDDCNCAINT